MRRLLAIIGILASIAIPSYRGMKERAIQVEGKMMINQVKNIYVMMYATEPDLASKNDADIQAAFQKYDLPMQSKYFWTDNHGVANATTNPKNHVYMGYGVIRYTTFTAAGCGTCLPHPTHQAYSSDQFLAYTTYADLTAGKVRLHQVPHEHSYSWTDFFNTVDQYFDSPDWAYFQP